MADSSQSSSILTDFTNSTIYRLDDSTPDSIIRMEDSINSISSAESSICTNPDSISSAGSSIICTNPDSLAVEDFSGFITGDPETDYHASDPFQGIFYHIMPLVDTTTILFYNKPIFNNILTVLSKQFSFPSEEAKKFQLKTYLDKKKCLLRIDKSVMTICASGPGHTLLKDTRFKKMAEHLFRIYVEETNTLLNTDLVNNSLSTSQNTTQDPEDNKVITETAEEPEAEPPAEPSANQSEQVELTHLHDSPVIRKISVLMDMISAMQGEITRLTKEVNELVQQHTANQSLYRTVDMTSDSSPTMKQSVDNRRF